MPWTDDVPEPERDLDELREVVAHRAGRLRARRRLGLASGAVAVVAALLVIATLPGGDGKPRRLQAADRPETSSTVEESPDGTIDPSEVYGEEPTTTVPGQTTSTTAKRKAGATNAAPVTATTVPRPTCATPTVPLPKAATERAIVGAWLLCGPASAFGPKFGADEAGIEVDGDGRWYKLVRGSDGGLQRRRNWSNGGPWAAIQQQQVNFDIDGGGTVMANAAFTADQAAMRLNNNGVHIADYARVPSGTSITDAPSGDSECGRNEGPVRRYASEPEFRSAIVRTWLLCGPPSYFGTSADGLEIRADGRWFELGRRGDGALVRSTTWSGTWDITDTSAMNGPGYYQLNLTRNGGSFGTFPTFATASTKMRLGYYGDDRMADHVHAPTGTQVVDG